MCSAADSTSISTMFMTPEDTAAIRGLLRCIEARSGGSPSKFFTMCLHVQRVLSGPCRSPTLSRLKRLANKVADVGGLTAVLGNMWSLETWADVQAVLARLETNPLFNSPNSPLPPTWLLDDDLAPAMVANATRAWDAAPMEDSFEGTAVDLTRISVDLQDTATSPQKPKKRVRRGGGDEMEEYMDYANMIASLDHRHAVASVLPAGTTIS